MEQITNVNIFLFHDFETLDIFGPIEILARADGYNIKYYSVSGGIVRSAQNAEILTESIHHAKENGIFVIPGGRGTRPLVKDSESLDVIRKYADLSSYCLSICTGSAVLAKCGLLDGRQATSNKQAFEWVESISEKVNWKKKARWCADGKFYTSSGVSAGIDMSLGFIADRFGREKAEKIAKDIEYIWNRDSDNDPFCP